MRKILSVILIAFCLYNCSSDDEQEEQFGNIYGVITEKSSAEPMKATGVELYSIRSLGFNKKEETLLMKTVTYDDGHYEFNELNPGNYKLKVVAENYFTITYDIEVEKGRTARADMQLEKMETYLTVSVLEVTLSSNKESALLEGIYHYQNSNYSPDEVGFFYATTPQALSETTKITGIFNDNYKFSATIKSLKKGTYYIQAYAKNSRGRAFSEIVQLEITGEPVVTTLPVTNVTIEAATLNGKIEYPGEPVYTEKGFVYSATFPNPTVDDPSSATKKKVISGTSRDFSANIADLTKDVTYHVRAYATNKSGTVYGNAVSFTTTPETGYWTLQASNLMVQKNDLSSDADWGTASKLCKSSTLGGYTDWHLPTTEELQEIYNNQSIIGKLYGWYWSKDNRYSSKYYCFNMSTGKINDYDYDNSFKVRAVRSIGN